MYIIAAASDSIRAMTAKLKMIGDPGFHIVAPNKTAIASKITNHIDPSTSRFLMMTAWLAPIRRKISTETNPNMRDAFSMLASISCSILDMK